MKENTILCAKQINHGRSEIWLEGDGRELTQRRNLATNEVVNVARRRCTAEAFEAFYKSYHKSVGDIATLDVPNIDEIASELKLNAIE